MVYTGDGEVLGKARKLSRFEEVKEVRGLALVVDHDNLRC